MRYPAFWQRRGIISWLLWPVSLITCVIARSRRRTARPYKRHAAAGCPVIVIGNISVGGTGKTPVLIALAHALTSRGYAVGIISRGYGAKIGVEPRDVAESASALLVGDEPWLIYQRLKLPMIVHPDRARASRQLRARYPEVNVILSDDGLQHHPLARTLELVVIDGARGLGNQFCLPAGPLREPASTLAAMDFVLVNSPITPPPPDYWPVAFEITELCDLFDERRYSVPEFIAQFLPNAPRCVTALAAIGHPERFFDALRALGLELEAHPLPDHEPVPTALLAQLKQRTVPILMTEKDAVKWRERKLAWHTQAGQVFAVCGQITLSAKLVDAILARLATRAQPLS